jgi:hypothetical protein
MIEMNVFEKLLQIRPQELVPSLKRWVVLGSVGQDEETWMSRAGGGRV